MADTTTISDLTEKQTLVDTDKILVEDTNGVGQALLGSAITNKINGALANYKGLNLNIDYTVTIPTDFNLLIGEDNKTTVYAILGTDSNTLNRPENNTNMGYLTVSRATIRNRYIQRWENVQNFAIYERIYNGSSWTSWQKVVTEREIKNITITDTTHQFGNQNITTEVFASFDLSSYKINPSVYMGVLRCGGANSQSYSFSFILTVSYTNWSFILNGQSTNKAELTFDTSTSTLKMKLTDKSLGLYEDKLTLIKIQ